MSIDCVLLWVSSLSLIVVTALRWSLTCIVFADKRPSTPQISANQPLNVLRSTRLYDAAPLSSPTLLQE
jgi:hypothetical protein